MSFSKGLEMSTPAEIVLPFASRRTQQTLSGSCLALTEGAAGMVSQVSGLAVAVGLPFEVNTVRLSMPWKKFWPGIIPVTSSVFQDMDWLPSLQETRLVISCGRQGMMGALWLKKKLGNQILTVHLQDPKIRSTRFDVVAAPEHDGAVGKNVLHTTGALHPVTPTRLAAAANSPAAQQLHADSGSFVAVALGGPNNCYDFSIASLTPLVDQLCAAHASRDTRFVVLPSRRTPQAVVELFQTRLGDQHLVWDGQSENPYLAALALASHLIVTGDSVSMISEASATEKPVYVFELPERRISRRFRRFHSTFQNAGITRPFQGIFESWNYLSPNPTQHIAAHVSEKLRLRDQQDHSRVA